MPPSTATSTRSNVESVSTTSATSARQHLTTLDTPVNCTRSTLTRESAECVRTTSRQCRPNQQWLLSMRFAILKSACSTLRMHAVKLTRNASIHVMEQNASRTMMMCAFPAYIQIVWKKTKNLHLACTLMSTAWFATQTPWVKPQACNWTATMCFTTTVSIPSLQTSGMDHVYILDSWTAQLVHKRWLIALIKI